MRTSGMMSKLSMGACLAGAMAGCADDPDAADPDQRGAAPAWLERFDRADAAFLGAVIGVDYGFADVPELGRLPHTFVTYRVVEPIHGVVAGDEVTLPLLGGPDERGLILSVSGLPRFDVGETDVLAVAGLGATACPLVDCAEGRIRVIGGEAFTDDGHLLQPGPGGELVRGPWRDLEEVRFHELAGHLVVAEVSPESADLRRPGPAAPSLRVDDLLDTARSARALSLD